MERHDFDSRTPNFFMFKKGGVNYCLKEASTDAVTKSADFLLSSRNIEVNEDTTKLQSTTVGKLNESQLILLEQSIFVCDPSDPDNPDKAVQSVNPSIVRGWNFQTGKFLGDKLDKMSGLSTKKNKPGEEGQAQKEFEERLGNS